jgi:hypothetical protein
LKQIFLKTLSKVALENGLIWKDYELYQSGKTLWVIFEWKKYRLKTLWVLEEYQKALKLIAKKEKRAEKYTEFKLKRNPRRKTRTREL